MIDFPAYSRSRTVNRQKVFFALCVSECTIALFTDGCYKSAERDNLLVIGGGDGTTEEGYPVPLFWYSHCEWPLTNRAKQCDKQSGHLRDVGGGLGTISIWHLDRTRHPVKECLPCRRERLSIR
jgi:hypothetical protein